MTPYREVFDHYTVIGSISYGLLGIFFEVIIYVTDKMKYYEDILTLSLIVGNKIKYTKI